MRCFSRRLISLWLNFPLVVSDARAPRPGGGFHCEAEGREEEGRGRPMRQVRLMVTTYRPRPENLRPEDSLSRERGAIDWTFTPCCDNQGRRLRP